MSPCVRVASPTMERISLVVVGGATSTEENCGWYMREAVEQCKKWMPVQSVEYFYPPSSAPGGPVTVLIYCVSLAFLFQHLCYLCRLGKIEISLDRNGGVGDIERVHYVAENEAGIGRPTSPRSRISKTTRAMGKRPGNRPQTRTRAFCRGPSRRCERHRWIFLTYADSVSSTTCVIHQ